MNVRMLSQEVIDGNLILDESFMDIDAKFVKLKKVKGDLELTGGKWTEIPEWLKDVEIEGDFYCDHNELKSLEGCPETIGGYFSCSSNQLISLEGCPVFIEGNFWCDNNKIELELPDYVKLKGIFINRNK